MKRLYDCAGSDQKKDICPSNMKVIPAPYNVSTSDEQMIVRAKHELSIPHDIDNFQYQAILAPM